ncbi:MAG: hypothetical protein M1812_003890 [Candelaria pacifica]|nr:MAG: hypothetical protein M1812_003890 [Candelaria pacifica]
MILPPKIDDPNSVDIGGGAQNSSIDSGERSSLAPPSRARSISDAALPPVSSSPQTNESTNTSTSNGHVPFSRGPTTPRRASFHARGLSVQVPGRDMASPNALNFSGTGPLSPKLDSTHGFGSPQSVLPRRSRGLDFSRACTNLHHSTIAEQSSPDSSPTISGQGMMIPPRKRLSNASMGFDSPINTSNSLWSTMANSDKMAVSSSVGSVSMLDSDSGSSESDDDPMSPDHNDDPILTTPQVYRLGNPNPFAGSESAAGGANASPGRDWMGHFSPAAASLMSFQRARIRKGSGKRSLNNGRRSLISPLRASPPPLKSVEMPNPGFATDELSKKEAESRRESLSLGTNELHLSSEGESDDGRRSGVSPSDLANPRPTYIVGPTTPGTASNYEKGGVVRRPVTRRGNLLPKTKTFARVRASLLEEGAPVDTEVRREAEVIRQVRESEPDLDLNPFPSQPTTTNPSPSLLPSAPGLPESLENIPEDGLLNRETSSGSSDRSMPANFTRQAIRNSGGIEFWNAFENRIHTPPPPLLPLESSSVIGDDMSMESPSISTPPSSFPNDSANGKTSKVPQQSRSSTPQIQTQPSAADISRKVNKRRRDDDFDPSSLKRRAVSPGMSLQNSPILSQSPGLKDSGWWGLPKPSRDLPSTTGGGHAAGEKASSGGSGSTAAGGGSKRIGFQGMNDTNDGLMNMSIE